MSHEGREVNRSCKVQSGCALFERLLLAWERDAVLLLLTHYISRRAICNERELVSGPAVRMMMMISISGKFLKVGNRGERVLMKIYDRY